MHVRRRNVLRLGLSLSALALPGLALGESAEAACASAERRIGGRLGVALVGVAAESGDRTLVQWRGHERFAMCSTFKLALAAAVLARVEDGELSLDTAVPFGPGDLVPYAPVIEAHLDAGQLSLGALVAAAVEVSDNVAANLLLARIGGPEGLTAFIRRCGDTQTRLDRIETALNENAPGDPRDTTTPLAMAGLMSTLLAGDRLMPAHRDWLFARMQASRTGLERIRAGLPDDVIAGDKTGTSNNAVNDIAFFRLPDGRRHVLTLYVDRPDLPTSAVSSEMAALTRQLVSLLG